MTDSVIHLRKLPLNEEHMSQARRVEKHQSQNQLCIVATHQVASRIYYPFHVSSMDERGFCPHSSPQAFDALYQNALGFLEKMAAEEAASSS
jgi:hypothetical protein